MKNFIFIFYSFFFILTLSACSLPNIKNNAPTGGTSSVASSTPYRLKPDNAFIAGTQWTADDDGSYWVFNDDGYICMVSE